MSESVRPTKFCVKLINTSGQTKLKKRRNLKGSVFIYEENIKENRIPRMRFPIAKTALMWYYMIVKRLPWRYI